MTSRGQICDKWHCYCVECGQKFHKNQTREGCPNGCGMGTMTRNKTKISNNKYPSADDIGGTLGVE